MSVCGLSKLDDSCYGVEIGNQFGDVVVSDGCFVVGQFECVCVFVFGAGSVQSDSS